MNRKPVHSYALGVIAKEAGIRREVLYKYKNSVLFNISKILEPHQLNVRFCSLGLILFLFKLFDNFIFMVLSYYFKLLLKFG